MKSLINRRHPTLASKPFGRLALAAGAAGLALGMTVIAGSPANAVGGYHTAGSGVRVRAAATTGSAQIASIPATGTALDIACQIGGENLSAAGWGTSPVWDKLNGYGGGYISDLFVRETPYAQFDPRIPRCDAPGPVASRETKAINWANAQLGRTSDEWGRPISGWCARWSVGAYGRQNAGYASAAAMYNAFRNAGMIHGGTAPAGTFVFFAAARVNGYAGHVAIADGSGGMITTSSTNIKHTALSYAGAPYLGWSYAPGGWSR